MTTALERLELSRALLQKALAGDSDANSTQTPGKSSNSAGPVQGSSTPWLTYLPGFDLLLQAAKFWWSRQPLHIAGKQLAVATNAAVKPIAQQHPIALMTGAFLVGSILVWLKPWRYAFKPTIFAGLLPQLISTYMAQQHPADPATNTPADIKNGN